MQRKGQDSGDKKGAYQSKNLGKRGHMQASPTAISLHSVGFERSDVERDSTTNHNNEGVHWATKG
jgi:hypothetical protein